RKKMKNLILIGMLLLLVSSITVAQTSGSSSQSTELDLSSKDLKKIPKEVFDMKDLKTLDLSNNNLNELPSEIENLRNLRVLDLRGNNIYYLPFELNRLKFLKEIYLDYDYWHNNLDVIKEVTRAR